MNFAMTPRTGGARSCFITWSHDPLRSPCLRLAAEATKTTHLTENTNWSQNKKNQKKRDKKTRTNVSKKVSTRQEERKDTVENLQLTHERVIKKEKKNRWRNYFFFLWNTFKIINLKKSQNNWVRNFWKQSTCSLSFNVIENS